MNKKLIYLVKRELNSKIRTKGFLISNIIFLVLLVLIINIDTLINFFGGDFEDESKIYVYSNNNEVLTNFIDIYKDEVEENYLESTITKINESDKDKYKDDILVNIKVENDIISASVSSNDSINDNVYSVISSSLEESKKDYLLDYYKVDANVLDKINTKVEIEKIITNETEDNEMLSLIVTIICMPLFILVLYLIQMVGASINEEKSTKSMEIIISNVSPKTHLLSKLISSNAFILIESVLLIGYAFIGAVIRIYTTKSLSIPSFMGVDVTSMAGLTNLEINSNFYIVLIILLIFIILTFIGYSLLAAITASMTTSMEEYQQVETPLSILSLVGYYLSIMSSMFKGSMLIKIFSYIPFISVMLVPTLYISKEITIIDILISLFLMLGVIFILIKYGLKIYKRGLLNYSGGNVWKKIITEIKK